jgi:hypothetical protein
MAASMVASMVEMMAALMVVQLDQVLVLLVKVLACLVDLVPLDSVP